VTAWTGYLTQNWVQKKNYERCKERSGSIKGGEFLDQLSGCQLLKKISVPWGWVVIAKAIVYIYSAIHVTYIKFIK
jgi:hypothetical protein